MSDDPAASLIGTPAPAPAADPAAPPAGAPVAAPADPAGALTGDAAWLETYSAQADGEGGSNRDWLTAKGFKDPDGVVKAYRSLESEFGKLKGSKLTVPGENATPEERTAFARAIGVPEKADGYEIKAPVGDDGTPIALNQPLIDRMREAALKGGVPKAAFETQVSDFIQAQIDEAHAETTRQNLLAAGVVKEWGAGYAEKERAIRTAAAALGLSPADMVGMRGALGADRALKLMARLGEGMAEDVLAGGGANTFGMTHAAAQKELDEQNSAPGMMAKLQNKSSPEYLRRQRLLAVVAAEQERKAAAG